MPGVWRGMVCGVVKDVEGFWVSGGGGARVFHVYHVWVCFNNGILVVVRRMGHKSFRFLCTSALAAT